MLRFCDSVHYLLPGTVLVNRWQCNGISLSHSLEFEMHSPIGAQPYVRLSSTMDTDLVPLQLPKLKLLLLLASHHPPSQCGTGGWMKVFDQCTGAHMRILENNSKNVQTWTNTGKNLNKSTCNLNSAPGSGQRIEEQQLLPGHCIPE